MEVEGVSGGEGGMRGEGLKGMADKECQDIFTCYLRRVVKEF